MHVDELFFLKLVEWLITIACIVLTQITEDITSYELIVYGTLLGYFIICFVIMIGYIIDRQMDDILNGLFTIIGCILFITGGTLLVTGWMNSNEDKDTKNKAMATGGLMIANGVIFLVDAILIFCF